MQKQAAAKKPLAKVNVNDLVGKLPDQYKTYLNEYEMILMKLLIEDQQRLVLMIDLFRTGLSSKLDSREKDVLDEACLGAVKEYCSKLISFEEDLLGIRTGLIDKVKSLANKHDSKIVKKAKIVAEGSLKKMSTIYNYDPAYSSFLSQCLQKVQDGFYEQGVGIKQVIKYKDGRVYDGYVKGGKKNGQGTLKYPTGDTYQGEWKNNEREGVGTYNWASGAIYTGDYNDNERSGQGKYIFPDGKVYEGEFEFGTRTGQGVMRYTNGDVFSGDFLNGIRHGTGEYQGAGIHYLGRYQNNVKEGPGELDLPTGQKYAGKFNRDTVTGFGTLTNPDGSKHEGFWNEGKRNGKGKATLANGDVYMGEFANDFLEGNGEALFASGAIYTGEFSKTKMHGKGMLRWPNGDTYNGEFADGKRHGFGEYQYSTGVVYKGHWVQDKEHGKAILEGNGTREVVEYKHGELQ